MSTQDYGCQGQKSYADSLNACNRVGEGLGVSVTLCTQAQLEASLSCATGCGYDNKRVWTLANGNSLLLEESSNQTRAEHALSEMEYLLLESS